MPNYTFKCKVCKKETTSRQSYKDPAPKCKHVNEEGQECGGETEKTLSSTSFQLKGGGWFKDGY